MGRRLERHVDFDLAERILASGPIKKAKPIKTTKEPREAESWRNAYRGSVWPGVRAGRGYLGPINLNRSYRWPRAKSYAHAREIGPSSEAVR